MDKIVIHLLVVSRAVLIAGAGTVPKMRTGDSIIKAVPGEKVYMSCEATGDPIPTFTWERDRKPVNVFGGRFSVNMDTQALRIFNVKLEDSSNYTCIAKNPFGVATAINILLVMVQPECNITSPTNLTFMEMTNQEIVCRSRGYPKPSFEWLTSTNQRIRPSKSVYDDIAQGQRLYSLEQKIDEELFESILFFQPITFKDSGYLVCVASNEIGSGRNKVTLNVHFSPKVSTNHEISKNVIWWEGHSTNLTCVVSGNDLPEITWTYNGRPYLCSILEEFVHGSEITSTCTIKHAITGGPGNYTCSADNRFGTILVHDFNVKEVFAPSPVQFRAMRVNQDEILLAAYVHPKEDTPQATFVLASYSLTYERYDEKAVPEIERMADVNEKGEATVKILGLVENRDYLVKLKAWNIVGFGLETSAIINTGTPIEAQSPQLSSETTPCSSQDDNTMFNFNIDFDKKNDDSNNGVHKIEDDIDDVRDNISMKIVGPNNNSRKLQPCVACYTFTCLLFVCLFIANYVTVTS